MNLRQQVASYENRTEEDLWEEVGAALLAADLGVTEGELSPEEKRDEARHWWADEGKKIRLVICESYVVRVFHENPEAWEYYQLFVALLDILKAIDLPTQSLFGIVGLCLKIGLNTLCPDDKKVP